MDRVEYEEELIEIDLREYIGLLWHRKWLIIGLVLIALVASYFFSQQITRIYQTSVMIMVEDQTGTENLFSDKLALLGSQNNKIATYSEILKSRKILSKVIKKLDLRNEETGEYISTKSLRENITVNMAGETNLLNIKVTYSDPQMAAVIANTLISIFKEENLQLKRADLTGVSDFITEQLTNVKSQLADLEQEILKYKENKGIYIPEKQSTDLLEKLTNLETGKVESELRLKQARVALAELEKYLADEDEKMITAQTFSKNQLVQNSKSKLAELELKLAGLKEVYTAKHPQVIETKARIDDVKERINNAVEEVVSSRTESINSLYQSLRQKIITNQTQIITSGVEVDTYKQQIDELNKELEDLPQKELELTRLQREREVTENIYLMLRENREEIQIQQAMKSSDIVVVDPAVVRETPVKPNVKLNMAIASFLALFVSIGIIFMLEYFDNTVKVEKDVEKLTGLPVLGIIPEIDSVDYSHTDEDD